MMMQLPAATIPKGFDGGMFAAGPPQGSPGGNELFDKTFAPRGVQAGMFANPISNMGGLEGALAQNAQLGAERRAKRQRTGQVVADALLAFSAGMGNPASLAMLQNNMALRRDRFDAEQKRLADEAEWQRKLREPRVVGSNLVQMLDDGSYKTLYNAPEAFEDYASALGFQPGSEDYAEAVRNYRLGSWSDDAVAAKQGLTGYRYDRMGQLQDRRYDRMGELQDDRLAVQRRGQDVASADRRRAQDINRRGQDIRSGDTQRGQDLTDRRVRDSAGFRGRGGRAATAPARAVNPTTGQAIVFKGGRWVDERTGAPVQ